jgi:hypothetical protein
LIPLKHGKALKPEAAARYRKGAADTERIAYAPRIAKRCALFFNAGPGREGGLMRYTWFFLLMLAASSFSAEAETMKLGILSVDFALPKDFCALSRSDPKDRPRFEQQERATGTGNLVLMIAIPCNEVAASRAGNNWSRWATWLQPGGQDHPIDIPGMTRPDVFTEIAKGVPAQDMKAIADEINARTQKDGIGLKTGKLAIVGQDGNGLYAAMASDVSNATQKRTVAGVLSWTVLSGRVLTLNLYADYEGSQSFDALLAIAKDVTQRSVAATDALQAAH